MTCPPAVVSAEREVSVTDRKGNDFSYGAVTVVRIERAKAVAATDYILDTSVLARALGEEGGAQARA